MENLLQEPLAWSYNKFFPSVFVGCLKQIQVDICSVDDMFI